MRYKNRHACRRATQRKSNDADTKNNTVYAFLRLS